MHTVPVCIQAEVGVVQCHRRDILLSRSEREEQMAVYEFRCLSCLEEFELMRPVSEANKAVKCPRCDSEAEMLISGFGSKTGSYLQPPGNPLRQGLTPKPSRSEINTFEASPQVDSDWWSDANLVEVGVVACASECTATGNTYRMDQQRLLDALNQGFMAYSLPVAKEFMPLTEVNMFLPHGAQKRMESTHIRKGSILFVAERTELLPGTRGGKRPKGYPLKTKKRVGVTVLMPAYSLVGVMYSDMWQQLVHTLDESERFLPLTDVLVSPQLVTGESRFDFVAINKDHIVHLGKSLK